LLANRPELLSAIHAGSINRDGSIVSPNMIPDGSPPDPKNYWEMLYIVVKLSVGPIISMIFYMLVQLVNTYFVGHTNDASLIAGVGMGNMLINVLAFAVMQGLNGALESLIS